MKFLPVSSKAAPSGLSGRIKAAWLSLSLALATTAPALAEKVEAIKAAKLEHPENQALIGAFTVLNWIAGLAILATIIFSLIWFFQRKDEDEDEDAENEAAEKASEAAEQSPETSEQSAEAKAASESELAKDESQTAPEVVTEAAAEKSEEDTEKKS